MALAIEVRALFEVGKGLSLEAGDIDGDHERETMTRDVLSSRNGRSIFPA